MSDKDDRLYLAAKKVMEIAGPHRYPNSGRPAPFYMGTSGCWAKGMELDTALAELQAALDERGKDELARAELEEDRPLRRA